MLEETLKTNFNKILTVVELIGQALYYDTIYQPL